MVSKIAIVGDGLSALITTATLAKALMRLPAVEITLIESNPCQRHNVISSSPTLQDFHQYLGINAEQFRTVVNNSYNLGLHFRGWSSAQQDYVHSFGHSGEMIDAVEFHHYITRLKRQKPDLKLEFFSPGAVAARQGRFLPPTEESRSPLSKIIYTLNLDEFDYCNFLRNYALAKGVKVVQASVTDVIVDNDNGFIRTLSLSNGTSINAEFFFDCSGSAAYLLGEKLAVPYISWERYLPFDRRMDCFSSNPGRQVSVSSAVSSAVSSTTAVSAESINSNTTSLLNLVTRMDAGFRKRLYIPGLCCEQFYYHSDFASDEKVFSLQQHHLSEKKETEDGHRKKVIALKPGYRQQFWANNCLAVGSAAGFVGDTIISAAHLAQSAVLRWLRLFPDRNCDSLLRTEYNRVTLQEYEHVRDCHALPFLCATDNSSSFWRQVAQVQWPESLTYRVTLFRKTGALAFYEGQSLTPQTWIALLLGFEIQPHHYDVLADDVSLHVLESHMVKRMKAIGDYVKQLPVILP